MDLRWADAIPTNMSGIVIPYDCVVDYIQINSNSCYGTYEIQVIKSEDGENYNLVYTAKVGTDSKAVTSMDKSTSIINVSNHGLVEGNSIQFDGSGVIAAPLDKLNTYYVKQVLNTNTFTLSNSRGGEVINLSSDSNGEIKVIYSHSNLNLYTPNPEIEFNQGDSVRLRFNYIGHTILDPITTIYLVEI